MNGTRPKNIQTTTRSTIHFGQPVAHPGPRMAGLGANPPLRPKPLLEVLLRHRVRFIILGGDAWRSDTAASTSGQTMTVRAAAVAIAGLVLSPAACARTIQLHWLEASGSRSGYPAMTFSVVSVDVGRNSWSVRASVTNRSPSDIRILTEPSPYLPYRFGLFLPDGSYRHGVPEILARDTSWLGSVSLAPRPPTVLRQGRTWRGTFSGRGTLPRRRAISVTFGVFVSPQLGDFSWTTAHAFTL